MHHSLERERLLSVEVLSSNTFDVSSNCCDERCDDLLTPEAILDLEFHLSSLDFSSEASRNEWGGIEVHDSWTSSRPFSASMEVRQSSNIDIVKWTSYGDRKTQKLENIIRRTPSQTFRNFVFSRIIREATHCGFFD